MTDFPKKSYYIKTQSYWYLPVLLGIFFTPIIIYALSIMVFKSDLVEGINTYWFLGAMLIISFLAEFLAKKITLSFVRISYNKEKITVDYIEKDKKTINRSLSYMVNDISSFNDFNFGGDRTFKLKFNNGEAFSLYGKESNKESGELKQLIKDFKSDIKLNYISGKSNANVTKSIKYHNFYNSLWGKGLLVVSCVALLSGVGLTVYVGYLGYVNSPKFNWEILKLPAILLVLPSIYLIDYFDQD